MDAIDVKREMIANLDRTRLRGEAMQYTEEWRETGYRAEKSHDESRLQYRGEQQ